MKLRYTEQESPSRIINSQRAEIDKYKWIRSEQEGRDIGWVRASQEWRNQHFRNWRRNRLERDVLLQSWSVKSSN